MILNTRSAYNTFLFFNFLYFYIYKH